VPFFKERLRVVKAIIKDLEMHLGVALVKTKDGKARYA